MDTISITTGCFAAGNAISKTSPALRLFIRDVREARIELDATLAEIHSLDGVLDILKDDATSFPPDLARRTPALLEHCTAIINQIEGYMHVCNGLGLTAREKKFRWLAIKGDMMKLRFTLEGYKSILAVVTDLVGLTKTRKENDGLSVSSDSSRYLEAVEKQTATNDDIKNDLTHVMADMGSLRGRLQGDFRSNYAVSDLESYLDSMQLHATNLSFRMEAERLDSAEPEGIIPRIPRRAAGREDRNPSAGSNSSSVGDEPDSAIDMNDGPPFLCQRSPKEREPSLRSTSAPSHTAAQDRDKHPLPIFEIDEFLDELGGEKPQTTDRPPTPPPRAERRSHSPSPSGQHYEPGTALSPCFSDGILPGIARSPSVARSVSEYSAVLHDSEGNPIVPRRMSSLLHRAESDGDAISTLGDLLAIRPPVSDAGYDSSDNRAVITTTVVGGAAARSSSSLHNPGSNHTRNHSSTSGAVPPPIQDSRIGRSNSRLFGRKNSFSVPARSTRPPVSSANRMSPALKAYEESLAMGTVSSSTAAAISTHKTSMDTINTTTTTTTQGGSRQFRPTTAASSRPGSVRSTSSRLSSVFQRLSFRRPRNEATGLAATAAAVLEEDAEPDDIFGVSLKKSMQMASASVRTHHDGSKGSSRREFPRCVFMCVSFIKDNGGVRVPNIFGGDYSIGCGGESMIRVAALKEAFSTAPWYGEGNIDWSAHDIYDAAELIILFLQQLRKPLITETVAKRWIVMSKQATLPGSMGMRLDSCIDFWDEALLGIRGAARSLFKLLLNLWGDVADAAELNDMTAERLAARLLNPLMHLPAGRYTTDYMLGLAFLIRKRSEYAIMLREGRKSHAAF